MKRFDFVLFDADNTLFDYDRAEEFALDATLSEFGVASSAKIHETYRSINSLYWRRFEEGALGAAELRTGRFADLAREIDLSASGTDLSERYLQYLGECAFLVDGAEHVVATLHRAGYRLGLITNGLEDVQKRRIERSPIKDYFASVTISEEVGAKKPDPRIFEIAFERSGHPMKDRSIVVGDSLSSDIAGGARFGIATCWYNPAWAAAGGAGPTGAPAGSPAAGGTGPTGAPAGRRASPSFVVRRLRDLPAIL